MGQAWCLLCYISCKVFCEVLVYPLQKEKKYIYVRKLLAWPKMTKKIAESSINLIQSLDYSMQPNS